MKFEKFFHQGVRKDDGVIKGGGAVITEGGIRIVKGNCGSENCHCSDGYSISIIMPWRSLTKNSKYGIVEGVRVTFDSLQEMEASLV